MDGLNTLYWKASLSPPTFSHTNLNFSNVHQWFQNCQPSSNSISGTHFVDLLYTDKVTGLCKESFSVNDRSRSYGWSKIDSSQQSIKCQFSFHGTFLSGKSRLFSRSRSRFTRKTETVISHFTSKYVTSRLTKIPFTQHWCLHNTSNTLLVNSTCK